MSEAWLEGAVEVRREGGGTRTNMTGEMPQRKSLGAAEFAGNEFKRGLAGLMGLPLDTMSNLVNLAIAGYGRAKGAFGSAELPELRPPPLGGSKTFERVLGVQEQAEPASGTGQFAGDVARVMGAAAVPSFGFARAATSPVASLLAQQGLAALAGTGGSIARAVAPETSEAQAMAGLTGEMIGGVLLPARVAGIASGARQLAGEATGQNLRGILDPYAERVVRNRMVAGIEQFPPAQRNLVEAAAIESEIPGLQFRTGQASGSPSIMDIESRVALSSGQRLNERISQERLQRDAIERAAQKRLPILESLPETERALRTVTAERATQVEQLPQELNAQETGALLRGTRGTLKTAYDRLAEEKFNAPVAEAERLGVRLDAGDIYERAAALKQNPLLKFDESNLPTVIRRIEASREGTETPVILGPKGTPISGGEKKPEPIAFSELKAMREAVNQDITREAGSGAPEARQRMRALIDIRNSIDRTAQQAPESVRNLYQGAVDWYRKVYAPKFLTGINLRQSLTDLSGERRILDERLAGSYFKPLGATPMRRFVDLYGDSPQAMSTMRDFVIKRYGDEVVRNGVIDPARHQAFLKKYGESLKQVPQVQNEISDIGTAAASLAAREQRLTDLQSVLSRGQLSALRSSDPDLPGLDSAKLETFLRSNGPQFEAAVRAIYGPTVAQQHMKDLGLIAQASKIADRGLIGPQVTPSAEPLPTMREKVGFTARTVFSLYRGIITGRTSPQDMTVALGTQAGANVVQKALRAAEERAISDPETSRLLVKATQTPITTKEARGVMFDLLRKGGAYWTGSTHYRKYGELRIPSLAAEASSAGQQAIQ